MSRIPPPEKHMPQLLVVQPDEEEMRQAPGLRVVQDNQERVRTVSKNEKTMTLKNKTEDRVILDMIEKMIDNGYVVRIARTGTRTHASAVSSMPNRENRFVESGGLTNAIAELSKKIFG